ncbi:translocator protein-like [Daphnia pulex]|uniref:translocator protein-like n=1 Tax=Daphnia pulex TaxID=6669 RepID=UPI001EDFB82C|nr:translocator protein-like [Daphnia pulex]XP_046456541.1 translocator protein-like [Daphnia pulex]
MEIVWSAIILTLLPWIGSLPAGMATRKQIKTWYNDIKKPNWRPPNLAFPIVWTLLYLTMGFASYLVWRDGGETLNGPAGLPLTLFAIQLVLNYAWSFIFFYYHNLEWAFYEVIALLIGIASCVYTFKSVNETASYLMMPYLVWVSFASLLTFTIWRMNLPANKKKI